jgi:hypothetical protein
MAKSFIAFEMALCQSVRNQDACIDPCWTAYCGVGFTFQLEVASLSLYMGRIFCRVNARRMRYNLPLTERMLMSRIEAYQSFAAIGATRRAPLALTRALAFSGHKAGGPEFFIKRS